MAISLRFALVGAASLITLWAAGSGSSMAQEQEPPAAGETEGIETSAAESAGEADLPTASPAGGKLRINVGPALFNVRTQIRTSSIRFETQLPPRFLEQIDTLYFAGTTGAGFKFDASYQMPQGFFLSADFIQSSPPEEDFADTRDIGNITQPGDFTLARFESEHKLDYQEWSFGGGRRVYPWKPRPGARIRLDVILQFRFATADYEFQAGELTSNPFNVAAFFDPRFDADGTSAATYSLDYKALLAGVRMDVALTERLHFESRLAPLWFGRVEGIGDLGPHGIVFVHTAGSDHKSPVFSVPNCDSDDPLASTPPCDGLVDGDLKNPDLNVEHKSSRARGLQFGLSFDYKMTDHFGLRVGYHRQDFRGVGGTAKRKFSNDAAAGCVGSPDPSRPSGIGPPDCPDETGDLEQAKMVTQGFTLFGTFGW